MYIYNFETFPGQPERVFDPTSRVGVKNPPFFVRATGKHHLNIKYIYPTDIYKWDSTIQVFLHIFSCGVLTPPPWGSHHNFRDLRAIATRNHSPFWHIFSMYL